MAPCLSKFPSVCLEAIFRKVPLVDLIRSVGLVCKSWFPSQRIELIRRRRLTIVGREDQFDKFYDNLINCSYETFLIQHVRRAEDGSPWLALESLEQIKFESLVVRSVSLDFGSRIFSLMPQLSNITHLVLMFSNFINEDMPPLIRLIGHFSQTLVVLKFHICNVYCIDGSDGEDDTERAEREVHNMTSLFACLDRLRALRHLRLYLTDLEFEFGHPIRPQLSFLSRLTTLALKFDGIEPDYISASLNQFGTNIESIDLYSCLTLAQAGQLRLQPAKLNVLSVDYAADYDDMRRLCVRFNLLTKLVLFYPSMPMSMLSRCMVQLTQLVHLDLSCDIPQVEEANEDDDAQPQIAQIPSVRMLSLAFESESHHDAERLFISAIFPNVQVIRLDHRIRGCPDCGIAARYGSYSIDDSQPELAAQLTECARLARQTFRACVHLHTVALPRHQNQQDTIITVNEL